MVVGLALASGASAVKPIGPACWGPTKSGCASSQGPIGGNIYVTGGLHEFVDRFALSHPCLGISNGLQNEVLVSTALPISKAGAFAFHGKGSLVVVPARPIPLTISGHFVSAKLAKITVSISYKKCRTVHLTVRYPG